MICVFAAGIQIASCAFGVLSMSWAPVAYVKAHWNQDLDRMIKYRRMARLFIWYFFVVGARVIAFTLIAAYSTAAVYGFIFIHWLLLSVCIYFEGKNAMFCNKTWQQNIFKVIRAILCEFIYMDFSKEPPNLFCAFFYIVMFIENIIILVLWCSLTDIQDVNPNYGYVIYFTAIMFIVGLVACYWYCWICRCRN